MSEQEIEKINSDIAKKNAEIAQLQSEIKVLEGEIDFGVNGTIQLLKAGSISTLEGKVPHDLTALKDSIVRLSLSKLDKLDRVEKVVSDSK